MTNTRDGNSVGACAESYCLRLGQILQSEELYHSFLSGLTESEKREFRDLLAGSEPSSGVKRAAKWIRNASSEIVSKIRGMKKNSGSEDSSSEPPAVPAPVMEAAPRAQEVPGSAALMKRLLQSPRLQAIAASRTSYTPSVWLLEQELRARGRLKDPVPSQAGSGLTRSYITVEDIYDAARAAESTGLCLSGGGIRSATFNLGILQGLSSLRALDKIDFLSTVSGGGYIHQFLAAWLRNQKKHAPENKQPAEVLEFVEEQLTPLPQETGADHLTEQPEPVRWLRRYSNYLTPRTGLFSADTWVVGAIWLRNTFLNQLVLIALLAALLSIPHLFTPTDWSTAELRSLYSVWHFAVPATGIAILTVLVIRRSIVLLTRRKAEEDESGQEEAGFWRGWRLVPMLLMAVSILASAVLYRSTFPNVSMVTGPSNQPSTENAKAQLKAADVSLTITVTARPGNGAKDPGQVDIHGLAGCVSPTCEKTTPGIGGKVPRDPKDCPYCANHGDGLDALKAWFGKYSYPVWTPYSGEYRLVLWALLLFLGFYAATLSIFSVPQELIKPKRPPTDAVGSQPKPWQIRLLTVAALVLSTAAGWGALHLIRIALFALYFFISPVLYEPVAVVILPVALMSVIFLCQVISAGIMGRFSDSALREDLARVRAVAGMWCAAWAVFTGASLLGPTILSYVLHIPYVKQVLSFGWVGTTFASVLAGKSSSTGPRGAKDESKSSKTLNLLVVIGPPVFAIGLVILIATGVQWAISTFCSSPGCTQHGFPYSADQSFLYTLLMTLAFGAVGAFFGYRLDINDFSMHAFYRDRIARCYAGASHPRRRPDPFTGFAATDAETFVSDLLPEGFDASLASGIQVTKPAPKYAGPFPIFCSTVNLSFGGDLAWQERKGASFAFTPLYSGYSVGFTAERELRKRSEYTFNGFVPTNTYAYPNGGIHMHSAVAISGAAVSPNWGYHTNPAMAFLLTMFNVRLGWWIKNPRLTQASAQNGPPSPPFPLGYLLDELLGHANDTHKYVYLTDGGHFDNMGLYELVRRRCRRILICDAENDANDTFEGIGMAIRKVRVDFGVEITLDLRKLDSRLVDPPRVPPASLAPCHFVTGTIRYPEDAWNECGQVLYIKASVTGDESGDVLNYKRQHAEFPHESTGDQWFSESQFESYRRLGYHIILEEPNLREIVQRMVNKN